MNKILLAAVFACALPTIALAQAAAPAAKTAAKTAAVSAAKPAKARAVKAAPAPRLARAAAKAVEEVTPIDPDTNVTLSPEDLEIAARVFVGAIKCELGANLVITADEKRPGFFDLQIQRSRVRFRMHPVQSRTGAIRLEDPRAGALWLQLGNKSMLMNQKIGERLADECQSPQQMAVAEEMKKTPPRSLFEPLESLAPN